MIRLCTPDAPRPLTLDDLLAYAETVRRLSSEDPDANIAVAWLILNRARAGAQRLRLSQQPHPLYGDGTLGAASRLLLRERERAPQALPPEPTPPPFGSEESLQALSDALCALTNGVLNSAGGATLLHHHLESPDWARGLAAEAFVGAYFFYCDPPEGLPTPAQIRTPRRAANTVTDTPGTTRRPPRRRAGQAR